MSNFNISLMQRPTNELVQAELIDNLEPEELIEIERTWAPERMRVKIACEKQRVPPHARPQSNHWNWAEKARRVELLAIEAMALVADGRYQGAALTCDSCCFCGSEAERGKPTLYIEYIETAPWNWVLPQIEQDGLFRGVGAVFLREIVLKSQRLSFNGRISLHSLPQSVGFYERLGMVRLDRSYNCTLGLPRYEFTSELAALFLEGSD